MKKHEISDSELTLTAVRNLLQNGSDLTLSDSSRRKIESCRKFLEKKISGKEKQLHYGINSGFGALHNVAIGSNDLEKLQRNLVLSHACGVGEEVPAEIVRIMLLLKIQGLSYGHSGTHVETVQRLIDFYNHHITPVVYQQGSLGASGDLAPLAHLALPLIGEGEVRYENKILPASTMNKKFGWNSLVLKSKEGLALLNGTQFMGAYGVWCLIEAQQIARAADVIGTASLEAFDGRPEPFQQNVNKIRNQQGQINTAQDIRKLFAGSKIMYRPKKHTQDPYSFRCIPQVHGAVKDAIQFASDIFEREINAVTDNPTLFPADDEIISGGNFHGEPLALALDFLTIALAELGSISERRIFRLISGERDLPQFLSANPGLNSGLMIPQYTAASIASQNKQLATPASVDSIESSNGQEDHVSMGANAATKCYRVVQNVRSILGIELITACQALEFRRDEKPGKVISALYTAFRKSVPALKGDTYLHPLICKSIEFTKSIR